MKLNSRLLIMTLAMLAGTPLSAYGYPGALLERQAHVTMAQARMLALAAHPGHIVFARLEREGGGSDLRYSFNIRAGHIMYEVAVDAQTGAVLYNVRVGAHHD